MIKLQVIGNLGKDAVVNNVNGKNVINFSVCHTEKFKDAQGNQKDKSTWVECAYWTDKTGIVPYLKKGTSIYTEGQPEVKTFSKNDGSTGANLSVRVLSVQLLGGSKDNQQSEQPSYSQPSYNQRSTSLVEDITEVDENLPF